MKTKQKKPTRAEVRRLEREVLRLGVVWVREHGGSWWFEGAAGELERAIVKLELTKARDAK